MRRVGVALLVLLGLALVIGSLLVWEQTPVAPPVMEKDVRQPFGSQKTIGTSALSHGGSVLPHTTKPVSDNPLTDSQNNDRKVSGSQSP